MLYVLPFHLEVLSVPFHHVDQHDPNDKYYIIIIINCYYFTVSPGNPVTPVSPLRPA